MSIYDDAYMDVMGRHVPGSDELKLLDIYLIGEALLNAVGSCVMLGHANPANSVLDYTAQPTAADHVSQHILRDLLAWQSGRKDKSPDCEDRLRAWVTGHWLGPVQNKKVSDLFKDGRERHLTALSLDSG